MFKIKIKIVKRIKDQDDYVGRYFKSKGSDRVWRVEKIEGDNLYWENFEYPNSLHLFIESIKSGEAIQVYKI